MSIAGQLNKKLSSVERGIVRTLLYYDVFRYPLSAQEIFKGCGAPDISMITVGKSLKRLVEAGLIYEHDGFYLVQDKPELVERRVAGNERAEKLMHKARKMSRFIGRFPFVRSVYLSGSISKGYVDVDSDIDYFIVTEPGRLWVARTLLIAYKKVFLLNSYKHFCVNYFVDTKHMQIEERNIFTATELMTLLPTFGADYYPEFKLANNWAKAYLPNYPDQNLELVPESKKGSVKTFQEWLLRGAVGEWLDHRFMKTTMKQWKRKFDHFDPEHFDVAMKSRGYVSKHHPNNFQQRVLTALCEKIDAFEKRFNTDISAK